MGLAQSLGLAMGLQPARNQDELPGARRMALPTGNEHHLLYLIKLGGGFFIWLIFNFFWIGA